MKKSILSAIFTLAVVFMTCITAYAGSCTAILDGPSFAANYTHRGSKYSLASSYATATGSRAKTYFYNLYSLSNTFVSWNDRVITFKLMEQDGILSNDDLVKTYTGTFVGKTLDSISLTNTNASGNIEAEGDHVSELYLQSYFTKHASDPTTASRSFFDYQLCQE